jgi:hypothetical protein
MTEPPITHVTLTRGEAGALEMRRALDALGVKNGDSFQIMPMNGTLPNGTVTSFAEGGLVMDFRGTA